MSSDRTRTYKRLNNRIENVHQPAWRKEKCLITFQSPQGAQKMVSLKGKICNLFAIEVGYYVKKAPERKVAFAAACAIWIEAAQQLLCA